jgi:hypothetical protein
MSACPLCGQRRARRACPGVNQTICAVCCGTKRLREIACPSDCIYLSSAREHPPAVVQRRQEQDFRFYLPLIAELSDPQYRLLLLFQAVTLKSAEAVLPPLRDEDVAEAAAAVAATLETAAKGIIYEHRTGSLPAQRLADDLSGAIRELASGESPPAKLERDAAVALRRLQQGADGAASALRGDPAPAFIALLGRLMAAAAQSAGTAEAEPEPPAPRIIIP